jgi:hypothetical protein
MLPQEPAIGIAEMLTPSPKALEFPAGHNDGDWLASTSQFYRDT